MEWPGIPSWEKRIEKTAIDRPPVSSKTYNVESANSFIGEFKIEQLQKYYIHNNIYTLEAQLIHYVLVITSNYIKMMWLQL